MAHIFKVKTTKPVPSDAEIVSKNGRSFVRLKRSGRTVIIPVNECGTRFTQESRKWYIQYRDATGCWQRVPGYADKEATAQLAAELERKAERRQSGLGDPHEDGKSKLLTDHLAAFRRYLESKGNSSKHVDHTCRRIERVLAGCRFKCWAEISSSQLLGWLAEERRGKRIGVKTSNHYLNAMKEFCQWMVRDGSVPLSPLVHLHALNAETDIRRQRRALSAIEFSKLIESAAIGSPIQGLSGTDRAMLYILAAWTGYRRGELASLTLRSFNFESQPATVSVKASYSKRRRNDIVPLHPAVVDRVKHWLANKPGLDMDCPLFALKTTTGGLRRTSKMMKLDLERVGIPYCDEDGLFADFHANRHTFISNLAKAGVSPKIAQSIARHSDVNLTLNVYSHVGIGDQAAAIQTLPAPPGPVLAVQDATSQAVDEKFAHGFAQTSDSDWQSESSVGNSTPADSGEGVSGKAVPTKQLVILCHALTEDDANSGAGTRTPDTRIMIPLL